MNVNDIRNDFPLLNRKVAGRDIVYLDNAATALKPTVVVEAMKSYLEYSTANIHRAKHLLSQEASVAYESVREKVARFINSKTSEVVFVRGATEAINVVADGLELKKDDNIVSTVLEHNSNILPWSSRCKCKLAPLLSSGLPDISTAKQMINNKTRLVAVTHCSNVTGAIVPIDQWIELAHSYDLPILIDAAQSSGHMKIDVGQLDCDYLTFSGHKLCGPTGAGVLYGKKEQLEKLVVKNLGGGAVKRVSMDCSYILREIPWLFEAGTPDIAAVIGFGAAIDYLQNIGMDEIYERTQLLSNILVDEIGSLANIVNLNPGSDVPGVGIFSFVENTGTFTPEYLARVLCDTFGIMARSGHHCAHPLHEYFGIDGTLRVSLQFYNTEEEIKYLGDSLNSLFHFA